MILTLIFLTSCHQVTHFFVVVVNSQTVYKQAMRKRDKDNDGFLSFDEFIADSYGTSPIPTTEHYIMEKDRFDNDFDADGDKKLNKEEVMSWLIPNNV